MPSIQACIIHHLPHLRKQQHYSVAQAKTLDLFHTPYLSENSIASPEFNQLPPPPCFHRYPSWSQSHITTSWTVERAAP